MPQAHRVRAAGSWQSLARIGVSGQEIRRACTIPAWYRSGHRDHRANVALWRHFRATFCPGDKVGNQFAASDCMLLGRPDDDTI